MSVLSMWCDRPSFLSLPLFPIVLLSQSCLYLAVTEHSESLRVRRRSGRLRLAVGHLEGEERGRISEGGRVSACLDPSFPLPLPSTPIESNIGAPSVPWTAAGAFPFLSSHPVSSPHSLYIARPRAQPPSSPHSVPPSLPPHPTHLPSASWRRPRPFPVPLARHPW